jgi:hypothetical protein
MLSSRLMLKLELAGSHFASFFCYFMIEPRIHVAISRHIMIDFVIVVLINPFFFGSFGWSVC